VETGFRKRSCSKYLDHDPIQPDRINGLGLISLRENAGPLAVGRPIKMGENLSTYGSATRVVATHKIIDSGKKTAEITKM
jgi:hypothetical protein